MQIHTWMRGNLLTSVHSMVDHPAVDMWLPNGVFDETKLSESLARNVSS